MKVYGFLDQTKIIICYLQLWHAFCISQIIEINNTNQAGIAQFWQAEV